MVSIICFKSVQILISPIISELINLDSLKQRWISLKSLSWHLIGELRIYVSYVCDSMHNWYERYFHLSIKQQFPIDRREKWMWLDLFNI